MREREREGRLLTVKIAGFDLETEYGCMSAKGSNRNILKRVADYEKVVQQNPAMFIGATKFNKDSC